MRTGFVAVALLAAMASPAVAHQSSVKYIDVTVESARARVKLTVAPSDVTEPLGLLPDARPSIAEAAVGKVAAYVRRWVEVGVPDGRCATAEPKAAPDLDGKFVVVAWEVTCPSPIDEVALDFTAFFAVDLRHEAILTVHPPGVDVEPRVVREDNPRFTMRAGERGAMVDWIHEGMDHIYDGRDHISFVLSLLLVVVLVRTGAGWKTRTPWAALKATAAIVTAFTVAHSMSLIAASLGWISLPSRLVESLIAVSILYVAVEDVLRPEARYRYALTFGFGLVHGLGFASVLEAKLPPTHVIVPLLSFNVGVELGQLTIVAIALPVFWLLCRVRGPEFYRRIVLAIATAPIILLAIKWLIERVFDVSTFTIWGM